MSGKSDAEVIDDIAARTNKSVSQVMKCSAQEIETDSRPTMGLSSDLERNDALYYEQKLSKTLVKNDANFVKYLELATSNLVMPDLCYNLCQHSVQTLRTLSQGGNGDNCQAIDAAVECLQDTGIPLCQNSQFVNRLDALCDDKNSNNRKMRNLEDDSEEDSGFLQETNQMVSVNNTRNLMSLDSMKFAWQVLGPMGWFDEMLLQLEAERNQLANRDKHPEMDDKCIDPKNKKREPTPGKMYKQKDKSKCIQWRFVKHGVVFRLVLKWKVIKYFMGVVLALKSCYPLGMVFKIPPILQIQLCIGGAIHVNTNKQCPNVEINIYGRAYFKLQVNARVPVFGSVNLATIELAISGGIEFFGSGRSRCQWEDDGYLAHESWLRRRRTVWRCKTIHCDVYVRATLTISLLGGIAKVVTTMTYYVTLKEFTIHLKVRFEPPWPIPDWEPVNQEIYRYYM